LTGSFSKNDFNVFFDVGNHGAGNGGEVLALDVTTKRFTRRVPNCFVTFSAGTQTIANIPTALTEYDDGTAIRRRTVSLLGYTQFRLHVGVNVTAVGGALGVQYSLDAGVNWNGLDNGTAATNSTLTQSIAVSGSFVTAWATINTAARINDILLRPTSVGGDGAEDPTVTIYMMEVR